MIQKTYQLHPDMPNNKYQKFAITAALRLGYAVPEDNQPFTIVLSNAYFGEHSERHKSDSYIGGLTINGDAVDGLVEICFNEHGVPNTFWDYREGTSSHESKERFTQTDKFINSFVRKDTSLTIADIAEQFHPFYKDNNTLHFNDMNNKLRVETQKKLRTMANELDGANTTIDNVSKALRKQSTDNKNMKKELDDAKEGVDLARVEAYEQGVSDTKAKNEKVVEVESKTKKQDAAWTESEFKYQGKLKQVQVVKDKYDQMVLKLLLDNGSFRQTKWDQDTIVDRARVYRELEGEEIETTVSNTSTSSWSGKRFFNSVRVVNGMVATTEEIVQF